MVISYEILLFSFHEFERFYHFSQKNRKEN